LGHRRAERVRAKNVVLVGFVGAGTRFTADLLDLSTVGLSVESSRALDPGTVVRLGIKVGYEIFRAGAIVRSRQQDKGFAVEFLQMTPQDRALLRRLYLRLAEPAAK
jgi:hypothetical protein